MIVTQTINVHLDRHSTPTIETVQSDTGRAVKAILFAQGTKWTPPEGATGIVRHSICHEGEFYTSAYDTLADGQAAVTFSENEMTIGLSPEILSIAGVGELQVAILHGDALIATLTILLRVQRNIGVQGLKPSVFTDLSQHIQNEVVRQFCNVYDQGSWLENLHHRVSAGFTVGGIDTASGTEPDWEHRLRSEFIFHGGREVTVSFPAGVQVRCLFYDEDLNCRSESQFFKESFTLHSDQPYLRLEAGYEDEGSIQDPAELASQIGVFYDSDYQGYIPALGVSSFQECDRAGYYRFDRKDLQGISDAPDIDAGGILEVFPHGDNDTVFQTIRAADGGLWFRKGSEPFCCMNSLGGDGAVTNQCTVNQHFYNSGVTGKYDLKDGYGYTADIYIAADGTETERTGLEYKCMDYIPVEKGISYTCVGLGYALYDADKNFLSADVNIGNYGLIREFTPEVDGYVRLTIRGNLHYARFCKTIDMDKCLADYLPACSPFSDPTVPCDVQLYGDSNSYGYGLTDTANSWANRLGALITSMPEEIENRSDRMSVFASMYSVHPQLRNFGKVYMSAYTNKFIITGEVIGTVKVLIDGAEVADMTASSATYEVDLGYHTIELQGTAGQNVIRSITTSRPRTFVNNAVSGYNSGRLPTTAPTGNIVLVMYGTNDRILSYGESAQCFTRFIRQCYAAGARVYLFSPIPTLSGGETDASYVKTINEVINEIPNVNYIDVYKDMQLFSLLSAESLYSDSLHLNAYGHKVLYCIAASGLHLAALNSIFDE